MLLSFTRTTLNGSQPARSDPRSPAVDLPLPLTVRLLPGRKVSVDLMTGVCLPTGHFGLLSLNRSRLAGMNVLLHADLLGETKFVWMLFSLQC
jgi:hypothetical protein